MWVAAFFVLLAACGRGGFDPLALDAASDAASDAAPDGRLDPTLVLAFAFDEASGERVVHDASGYGNDGALAGPRSFVPAQHGNGLLFDGLSSNVVIPPSSSLEPAAQLTVSFWVRIDGADEVDDVLIGMPRDDGVAVAPYYVWGIELDDNGIDALELYIDGTVECAFVPPHGVLVYVAFTFDGRRCRAYLDGVVEAISDGPDPLQPRGQPLVLGADPVRQQPFQGILDNLRIYARALSEAEVRADRDTPIR